mgnify:CR=1 FL=1
MAQEETVWVWDCPVCGKTNEHSGVDCIFCPEGSRPEEDIVPAPPEDIFDDDPMRFPEFP